jgi:hypothetical protein
LKPQDKLGTTEVGKAQSASTTQPSTSTTLIKMVVGLQKIGRKILGFHSQNTGNEPLTPEKIFATREEVTQVEDEAVGEAKTNHCITCIMKMIQTTGQNIV